MVKDIERVFKGRKYNKISFLEQKIRKIVGLSSIPPRFANKTEEYENYEFEQFLKSVKHKKR